MKTSYYTYILSNEDTTAIFTGVTDDLLKRCFEHRHGLVEGPAKTYGAVRLLYFEAFDLAEQAYERAKQIRAYSRARKAALVHSFNPRWTDLFVEARIEAPPVQSLFHVPMVRREVGMGR